MSWSNPQPAPAAWRHWGPFLLTALDLQGAILFVQRVPPEIHHACGSRSYPGGANTGEKVVREDVLDTARNWDKEERWMERRVGGLAMWPCWIAKDKDKYWERIPRRCAKSWKNMKNHCVHCTSPVHLHPSKTSSIGLILRCTAKKLQSQNKITALPLSRMLTL